MPRKQKMAMKMATEIKMCLGPNGFSDFLAGFKSLSLRHENPLFVYQTNKGFSNNIRPFRNG